MKKATAFLFLAILSCALFPVAATAQHQVDSDALIDETQQASKDDDRMNLIWWIPTEFWRAIQEEDPTASADDFDVIIDMFKPYTIVLVLDGEISDFGSVTYRSKEDIRNNLRLIDRYGDTYKPIAADKIDSDTKTMLAIMKPMLANMLGPMGENMEFYVFPGNNSKGEKMVQPREEETFEIALDEESFKWRLPLGALLPPKFCPVDDESMSGAWNYCPYHGKALKISK